MINREPTFIELLAASAFVWIKAPISRRSSYAYRAMCEVSEKLSSYEKAFLEAIYERQADNFED